MLIIVLYCTALASSRTPPPPCARQKGKISLLGLPQHPPPPPILLKKRKYLLLLFSLLQPLFPILVRKNKKPPKGPRKRPSLPTICTSLPQPSAHARCRQSRMVRMPACRYEPLLHQSNVVRYSALGSSQNYIKADLGRLDFHTQGKGGRSFDEGCLQQLAAASCSSLVPLRARIRVHYFAS